MLHGTSRTLLAEILNAYFPMIAGPEELPRVVELLDQRGGEFCGTVDTSTEMVASASAAGFLPMSESFTGFDILLVKSHQKRCVHDLSALHVSRSDVRRSRGTTLRFSAAFTECLRETVAAHKERWLTDSLCRALTELSVTPRHGVQTVSVELYRDQRLIAGEIGYRFGGTYTSMSGFYHESGSGKVQLLALGVALRDAGFALWDLGMPMDYKMALGARTLERKRFIDLYQTHRNDRVVLPATVESCQDLLAGERERGVGIDPGTID